MPCAESGMRTVFRGLPAFTSAARTIRMPASSPWAPAEGCSVTRARPVSSARIALEPPGQLERALGHLLGRERVRRREAGQARDLLVDPRVVLHRAGAERIEARVDREVQLREAREVADDVDLGDLGLALDLAAAAAPPGSRPPSGTSSGGSE